MADQAYDGFISYSHAADDLLAPRLQSGLQRFAKPWWKRRALRIFRDESSLSANPHLWSSITEALDSSAWFVLLLSPDAARSEWVNQEIEYWKSQKDASRILPVLTDGTFTWTEDDIAGDAVPEQLEGVFSEEPRWVDMRFARDEEQLDLKNPRFSGAVADIASALRGVPKDELESEEVKQHRRTLRTAWAGGLLLVLLAGTALAFAVTAQSERDRAERNAEIAIDNEQRALEEAERANAEAERADLNADLARSRELAASAISVLDEDAELSLLLGIEAIAAAPSGEQTPIEAVSALHEAVRSTRTILRRPMREDETVTGFDAVLSPDANLIAATGMGEALEVWDASTGELIWEITDDSGGGWFWHPHFSPDSSTLVVAFTRYWTEERVVEDGLASGIYHLDSRTGEQIDLVPSPTGCEWIGLPVHHAFTPDGSHLLRLVDVGDETGDACYSNHLAAEMVDLISGEVTTRHEIEANQQESSSVPVLLSVNKQETLLHISEDAYEQHGRTRVVDLASGDTLWERLAVKGVLDPDGTKMAIAPGTGQRGVDLVDARTGTLLTHIGGRDANVNDFIFSSDGEHLVTAGARGVVGVWEADTGELLLRLTGSNAGVSRVSLDETGERVAGATEEGVLILWDLSTKPLGEIAAYGMQPAQVTSWGLDTGGGMVAVRGFSGQCPSQYSVSVILDAMTGEEVLGPFYDVTAQTLVLTPDGSRLVYQRVDPSGPDVPCSDQYVESLAMRDVLTGEIESTMEGLCRWIDQLTECPAPPTTPFAEGVFAIESSADGRYVVAGGLSVSASLWDIETGEMRLTLGPWADPGEGAVRGVGVDPSNTMIAVSTSTSDGSHIRVFDMTGNPLAELEIDHSGQLAFNDDGSRLAASASQLVLYDTSTWTTAWEPIDAHDGGIVDLDFSPDGTTVVTAGFDGFVRFWEAETGRLVHLIPLEPDWAKAVSFVDDSHVAVGTQEGIVAVLTTDVETLVNIGKARLTRSLTTEECQTYLHVDTCPAG